jgi:hypothetical protein
MVLPPFLLVLLIFIGSPEAAPEDLATALPPALALSLALTLPDRPLDSASDAAAHAPAGSWTLALGARSVTSRHFASPYLSCHPIFLT